jgi:two-component system NarL family sensor kinase
MTPGWLFGDDESVRVRGRISPASGVAATVVVGVLLALLLPAFSGGYRSGWLWWMQAPVGGIAFGLPAVFVLRRDSRSVVGWLLATIAMLGVIDTAAAAWAWATLIGRPGSLPGGPAALWLASILWLPAYMLLATVLLLVAPDGQLPSPRWRPAMWFACLSIASVTVVNATGRYHVGAGADVVIPGQRPTPGNPFESPWVQHNLGWTAVLIPLAIATALTALVVRHRRSNGVERRQLDVVCIGAAATVLLMVSAFAVPRPWFLLVVALALIPYPVALAVAAVRHQLWQLDVIVRRSLVYGVVSAAIVAAYVLVIAGLGGLLGERTGAPLVATAIVAVGAAPLRSRLQRSVDSRLYGDRADPVAAVRRVAGRWGSADEPLLDGMAADIARSLRLPYVRLVSATGAEAVTGVERQPVERLPLVHEGVDVGHLEAGAREPGRPLSRRDRDTLAEIGRYVALVLHALGLRQDLQQSRERIVLAREEERRRLRRDLHDGLGPQLAAIALQLETVRDLASGPDTPAGAMAESLRMQMRDVVAEVRRIVDDLRPPALDDLGLGEALRQLVTRFDTEALSVDVGIDDLPPLPAAVEVGVLRLVGEALTNVARHSGARRCAVEVGVAGGQVVISVSDDGRGISPDVPAQEGVGLASMRERALELGGTCEVTSPADGGTVVRAWLPM